MATAKKAAAGTAASSISLMPEDPKTPRPRLHKLIIKNFRAIGPKPVEIELDEIVVLVGPNNAGKSSILRAYDVAMKQGSTEGKLQIEDFPGGKVLEAALPESNSKRSCSITLPVTDGWHPPLTGNGSFASSGCGQTPARTRNGGALT